MYKIIFGYKPYIVFIILIEQFIQLILLTGVTFTIIHIPRQDCRVILGQQLTFIPSTSHLLIVFLHDSVTVLFTIFPMTDLLFTIFPEKLTKPMFLVILVIAFVYPAIWPCKYALTVNPVVFPCTFEHPSVYPALSTMSMDVILTKVTRVRTTICPLEFTFPMFQPIYLSTHILTTIMEHFHTLPILLIQYPMSLLIWVVDCMKVCPVTMCFVIEPFSVILIPFDMF